jgi:hypothetical protein
MSKPALLAAVSVLAVGCSSSPPPVDPPPAPIASAPPSAPAAEEAPPPTAPAKKEFPTACATAGADVCTPPTDFVERLCGSSRTDVAFAMFAKGTPWTRGYLTRDTDAWNASGGGQSHNKLVFDEEVIVLKKREAGGIIVGQGGGFQVLRWDGSCADLQSEELTQKHPPKAKYAQIGWRAVESKVRDAVLTDAKVNAAYDKRRKECKGATSGDVSLACVKADAALDAAIIEHVQTGGTLPPPPAL